MVEMWAAGKAKRGPRIGRRWLRSTEITIAYFLVWFRRVLLAANSNFAVDSPLYHPKKQIE